MCVCVCVCVRVLWVRGVCVVDVCVCFFIFTILSTAVPLFNAPLQAWVLVGVGVLVAIVYGTKPLWWDRYVSGYT